MDADKRSEQEDDTLESEIDATDDGEGASSADGSVLRKRVTFDASDPSDTEPTSKRPTTTENQSSMGTVLVLITLAFVVFSSLGFYYNTSDHSNDVDPEWITEQLTKNVRIVRSKFPSQTKTIWADFYAGIQKVLLEKPTEPSMFLLVHTGTDATSSCLARKVGGFVHALLNPSNPDVLVLDAAKVGSLPAATFAPLVDQHRVVVLDGLQLVAPGSAKGLGVVCNTAAPLVDQAVYIFTLKVSNGETDPRKSAEKELNAVWNKLDKTSLNPLVKCITGGHVFKVHPEKTMAEGC